MRYVCNPVNFPYMYQFNKQSDGTITASREAADPSMVMFQGKYLIFPSMTCGFLYSENMDNWEFHPLKNMPVYDYAPDVKVVGEYLYFCASNHEHGIFYRTKDPFTDEYEKIEGKFPFWDPDLFVDDDGRLYFYWGSSTVEPLYGVELDPETLHPIGEPIPLFAADPERNGFERSGENHVPSMSKEQIQSMLKQLEERKLPLSVKETARQYIMQSPYVEGAWMNKHKGKYYLQYGTPGSRYNIYGDGVYVSEQPLGPFVLAKNNPYSYKPGGFLPGAGHGSSMEDQDGTLWHTSTMRICVNHNFERRIGIWPGGWDEDGEMFCNQRFGDWPYAIETMKKNPWAMPQWMLLSYKKPVNASSCEEGKKVDAVTDEDIRTCWKAETSKPGEWIEVDLGRDYDVHAIQINFSDDHLMPGLPDRGKLQGALHQERWIDEIHQPTRWRLEGSVDGENYFVLEDKTLTDTDLPHDLVVKEEGVKVRFVKLTVDSLPYGQAACVSGIRVFGLGEEALPKQVADVQARWEGDLDIWLEWQGNGIGYVVEWGYAPDKLYHSYQVFDSSVHLGGLVQNQEVFIRVDSFNESGITKGNVIQV